MVIVVVVLVMVTAAAAVAGGGCSDRGGSGGGFSGGNYCHRQVNSTSNAPNLYSGRASSNVGRNTLSWFYSVHP